MHRYRYTDVGGVGYDGRKLTPAVAPTRPTTSAKFGARRKEEFLIHEFFIPMEHVPTITHQEHKIRIQNGRPVFYEPPELQRVRQIYLDMLARHKPERKLAGPLALHVVWCFLTDRHPDGAWRDTKPDTDNLQKLLKDCMTAVGFWADDAQVCSELTEKRWVRGIRKGGTASGIWISVREMEATEK